MSEQLRPGWYARTPDGRTESWWDGERWTGDTRPTPGTEPTYEETAKERVARRMVYGGLCAVGAVVVLTIGAMVFGGSSDDAPDSDVMGEGEARVVCEEFVRDRLTSPGTADFQRPDISQLTNGQWRVEGSVDSENGFGALLRSRYSCVVSDAGDGVASLIDLEFTE